METLLEVKNLKLSNKDIEILKDISFSLKKGEILAVVGESGCGKSTLSRALTQMMGHDEKIIDGEIIFDDKNILKLPSEEKRKLLGKEIGVILQNPGSTLNPIRKIEKQFVEVLKSHMKISKKEALKTAENLLEKLNFKEASCILNSYPFELSGGMRQRIALALAVIMKPKILVADEPTSALDTASQYAVVKELISLRDNFDTSIIVVTHSMKVVSMMADKVAVMYGGKILEFGDKEAVMEKPSHPYTKALINAVPKIGGNVPKGLKGSPPKFSDKIEGCIFKKRCHSKNEHCGNTDQKLRMVDDTRWIACSLEEKLEISENV